MKGPWTCPKCKGEFGFTQPIIMDGMKGYETPLHECGEQFQAMRLKPCSKDAKKFWDSVLAALGEKP